MLPVFVLYSLLIAMSATFLNGFASLSAFLLAILPVGPATIELTSFPRLVRLGLSVSEERLDQLSIWMRSSSVLQVRELQVSIHTTFPHNRWKSWIVFSNSFNVCGWRQLKRLRLRFLPIGDVMEDEDAKYISTYMATVHWYMKPMMQAIDVRKIIVSNIAGGQDDEFNGRGTY